MINPRLALAARRVILNQVRRSHDEHHVANWGDHFFFSAKNHRIFAVKYMLFFAIPFWIPFICVRYHITK